MKTNTILIILVLTALQLNAQNANEIALSKVQTLDSIMHYVYKGISSGQGEGPDFLMLNQLFYPTALALPVVKGATTPWTIAPRFPAQVTQESINRKRNRGFYETEIYRVTESFGQITHCFSTYEAKENKDDAAPFLRGINSFQLFNDGNRWWIMSLFWMEESVEHPIPDKYLPAE